jgi:hypothetical protein
MLHPWLGPLALLAAIVYITATPPPARGYWSAVGNGGGSANVATLAAPTITAATAGAETVELSWSAVSAPGEGTVEYYVTRDGASPSAACPSASAPSSVSSCTDTNVPVGTHKYAVTALWRSWSTEGEAHSVTVSFGPATHLVLEASSATPTAAEADNLTVTVKDAAGNTVRSYTGTHSLTFEGASQSPSATKPTVVNSAGVAKTFGEATELTFTEGKATVAGGKNGVMRLYRAEEAHIIAREGSLSNGAGLAVTVKVAATKKLSLASPGEQTAGVAFNVTVTATDEYGNTTASYAGAKSIVWSGPANSPSGQAPEYPSTASTVMFTEGVGTASGIDLYDAVASVTLTAKEGATIKGSVSFPVVAAAASSFSVPTPTEREAGAAFNETVTAWDPWHNTAKTYTGAKTLTWSGPTSSPSGQAPSYPATVTFAAGAGTASIKLYDAQNTTLKANEGTLEGTTSSYNVKAAATKKFSLPTPSEQEAGVAFNLTLTAIDSWGNITTGYSGAKTLTWSGPANSPSGQAASYPATVTFAEGVGTASSITLYDAQSTTLKAKEGAAIEGTSGSFTVKASAPERLAWAHPEVTGGSIEAGTCPFSCRTTSIGLSKKFKARASVTDRYANIVSNLGAATKAKVEKSSGEGTLANATGLTIPTSGLAESATVFEYTSPASGASEALLKLGSEEGTAYTEAEAHIKY